MAHLVETMAFAGELPWHGLGVPVSNDLSPEDMLKKAGLEWEVNQQPLYAHIGKKQIIVPDKKALVRSSDERVLTIISDDWKPVQNSEAFEFFKEFVDNGEMEMHTAGSLRDGNMVWALAKVKDSFALAKGKDVVESYLLFSNPHEYGKSIDVRFTPIRVVCNNTLTLSLSRKADMSVRLNHRKDFDPVRVKEMLGIAHTKLAQYKEAAEFLSSKSYKTDTVIEYLQKLFPHSNAQTAAQNANDNGEKKLSRAARLSFESLTTQPGADMSKNTWWNAFNAVTFNTDHVLGHNNATRLNSIWYGPMKAKKVEALELAVEYAKAA